MRRLLLLASALVFSTFFSCAREPSVAPPPGPRVVVLSPALGAIVRDLGLAGTVVGRHAWDTGFSGVPSIGDQTAIDYERLRRVSPTHVLLQWGDRALPPRLLELAADAGWELTDIEILTLDEISTATRAVAAAIGDAPAQARAEELVTELNAALAPNPELAAKAGRVVALYGVNPMGVAGPGSFTYEMIERLGADAVPDTGAPFIAMDPEDLRRLDPDTIVIFAPGASDEEQRAMLAPLGRLDLRAAREGRVFFVVNAGALLPGTGMIGVALEVGRVLMGEVSDP